MDKVANLNEFNLLDDGQANRQIHNTDDYPDPLRGPWLRKWNWWERAFSNSRRPLSYLKHWSNQKGLLFKVTMIIFASTQTKKGVSNKDWDRRQLQGAFSYFLSVLADASKRQCLIKRVSKPYPSSSFIRHLVFQVKLVSQSTNYQRKDYHDYIKHD